MEPDNFEGTSHRCCSDNECFCVFYSSWMNEPEGEYQCNPSNNTLLDNDPTENNPFLPLASYLGKMKAYKCSHCNVYIKGKVNLERHFLSHTGEKPYTCVYCGNKFSRNDNLKTHVKLKHTLDNTNNKRNEKSKLGATGNEKPHECSECDMAFSTKQSLKRHNVSHTQTKPFQCSYCDITLTRKDNLVTHIKLKHSFGNLKEKFNQNMNMPQITYTGGEKMYKCRKCELSFKKRFNLETHFLSHNGEKLYHCNMCSETFSKSSAFNTHIKIKHILVDQGQLSNEKTYKCSQCGLIFKGKVGLERHFRSHTRDKRFVCINCGSKFLRLNNLKDHLRLKHNEKPYQCNQCDQSFIRKKDLHVHFQNHKEVLTDIDTTQKSYEVEKPYKCTQCDMAFKKTVPLERHYRIHTGEKPYKCNFCGYKFSRNDNLKTHIRVMHKEMLHHCS